MCVNLAHAHLMTRSKLLSGGGFIGKYWVEAMEQPSYFWQAQWAWA